jgi:membrane-bound lytic murein transglycosylase MltF
LPDCPRQDSLVILAFSGGGTRAAAFSYGVLEFLRRTEVVGPKGNKIRLIDEVDIITGVSGASFTALAYGELTEFHAYYAKQAGGIPRLQRQYMSRIKALKDSTASEDYKRFAGLIEMFEKYGKQYNFEPMMLAAQGFQESTLNQDAKSPVGAIGVMQVMPATGVELGVGDIRLAEPNIHAGTKYMDQLMTRYFKDAKFDAQNRTLFAFASYNCGPGNVSKMRKEAVKRGLDPDQWFNNVENVTAEKIGIETTTYVRNIFKYYVAYKLASEARQSAASAKEQVAPAKK